ncbi:transcription factor A, mitochondrial-like isoform X2 [Myxocyprinus asiaticus]|uniref:transcription factor A, mitochondrial-like isoform X2 n=1 Tax=Myxocyprinus asiaticus TaxID=70543 RepID=UPI002222BB15|nr:transcription factor A, mitochondrial-like isoform X2 [Myxocyprinus asiaticus]
MMAPFSLLSVGADVLLKSLGLFSTASAVRCSCVVPLIKSFSTTTGGPPKRPLTAYMKYVQEIQPTFNRQNPGVKNVDIVRKIAQQWRMLTPEQKQPFQDASLAAREQYKLAVEKYKAQLTPAQSAAIAEERRQKMAKRKAIRKKKELNTLGKPKRSRSAFNIFMAEHFEEARGTTMQGQSPWSNLELSAMLKDTMVVAVGIEPTTFCLPVQCFSPLHQHHSYCCMYTVNALNHSFTIRPIAIIKKPSDRGYLI